MNDSLLTVEQASANSLVPNSLILQLKAENLGYAEVAARRPIYELSLKNGLIPRNCRSNRPAQSRWQHENSEKDECERGRLRGSPVGQKTSKVQRRGRTRVNVLLSEDIPIQNVGRSTAVEVGHAL